MRQSRSIDGVHKTKNLGLRAEGSDQPLFGGYAATNHREKVLSENEMIFNNGCAASTKKFCSALLKMLQNKLPQLVDDRNGVDVALALRFAPSEEPMSAENDPVTVRRLCYGFAQHHGQLKAGALPRQPD